VEKAPVLWATVEELSRQVGARSPDFILINSSFNASCGSVGIRQKRCLVIGYPMWNVLSDAERIGLLTHELAHDANHDLRRSLLVGTALGSLTRWFNLLTPSSTSPSRRARMSWGGSINGALSYLERLIPFLFAPIAAVVALAGRGLRRISERDGQRSEYLADDLSADLAGSEAAKSLLIKVLLADGCQRALQTAAQQGVDDLWAAESEFVESVPEPEILRRRRIEYSRLSKIDASHPPTEFRIRVIESRPLRICRAAQIRNHMSTIDDELRPWADVIESGIKQNHPAIVRGSRPNR
jgi:Zn-dependent protease with chaperone function